MRQRLDAALIAAALVAGVQPMLWADSAVAERSRLQFGAGVLHSVRGVLHSVRGALSTPVVEPDRVVPPGQR
jgi:hypothetical protein